MDVTPCKNRESLVTRRVCEIDSGMLSSILNDIRENAVEMQ